MKGRIGGCQGVGHERMEIGEGEGEVYEYMIS